MSNIKKQIWTVAGVLIIAASIFLFFSGKVNAPDHQVVIGSSRINVELAQTPEARAQGLSGHKPLADNEGMLFIFDKPGMYGFWMKDMLFAIDIIWLAPSEVEGISKIVHMEKNISPNTYPKVFAPKEYTQYVLEVNAGIAEKNNWAVGDEVKF